MNLRPKYVSYLLRLWQISDGGQSSWRASLESPGSGDRRGFASLAALIAYLEEQTRTTLPEHVREGRPALTDEGEIPG